MAQHFLPANDNTVRVGLIDPAAPPVLTVSSGDEVQLATWGPWGNQVGPDTRVEDFPALRAKYPDAQGPHALTGPIAVEGARPGDTLRIDLLELIPGSYGYNMVVAQQRGTGVLRERFQEGHIRHFELDADSMTTQLHTQNGTRTLQLAPFLGILGVAPPGHEVRSTIPPGTFGGNIDLRELVAGTTLFLPIFKPGAGFYAGDAHGMQGDGEVNQTALETSMEVARLRLSVIPSEQQPTLVTPRAETPTHIISLGLADTLEEATVRAVDDLTNWLIQVGYTAHEAYSLCSLAASVRLTQGVNRVVGMHAMLDKQYLDRKDIV